ncbi:MAG: hypothetical protein JWO82_3173 [Akkermansiaceae bacterium]|nr:hypothetical protein [Akkermansiaceae bacterium]
MSKETKSTSPVTRAVLGVTALAVIAVSANILISSLGVGYRKADFTENKSLTLSDGTKSILKDIGAPVVIRYYATRSSNYMPQQLKIHMKRVDDLLRGYETLSGGKIRVENLDPQPDTDAEDSAEIDGIRGQRLQDENLYFGLAISCLDRTTTIPFLDPSRETMLEYELSRAITDVSRPSKPIIGLMSALPIQGSPGNPMMGQQGARPWVIYQQLAQSYEVRDLTMTPEKIDPSIDVLLVFHPAAITPEAEFAIDQYVLQGGTVIACVDPFSIAAQQTAGGRNPMMGGGGVPTASTLPHLLPAWGLAMDAKVVGDRSLGTQVNESATSIAVLTLPKDNMPQKDDVVTKDLTSVTFFLPGGITKTDSKGLEVTTLIRSSVDAGLVDPQKASRLDPSIGTSLAKAGHAFDLAVHLKGSFKTAFPEGNPAKKDEAQKDGENKDGKKDDHKLDALATATKPGNVFVIGDVDAFFDNFAYQVMNFGGSQVVSAVNGNSSLLMNLVDQAASSPYLIGARSRAAIARPFTKIKELEDKAEASVGEKIQKFEDKAKEAQERLVQLQAEKPKDKKLYLTDEQESQIKQVQKDQVDARKAVRDLQKDLKKDKDKISNRITLLCVAGVPVLVILFGFVLFLKRRVSTGAR